MPHSLPLLPLVLDRVPRGLRLALSQEGIPWVSRNVAAIAGRFVLFDSQARKGKGQIAPTALSAGQTPIDVDMLCDGERIDPFDAMIDNQAMRFEWNLSMGTLAGPTVSEEVARYDKRAIRARLLGRLQQQIESHAGLWLRLASVPFPYRTAFHLRVDHDDFDSDDFHQMFDVLAGYEDATTHYLNGRALEGVADEAVARLRGLDIGSHAYYHHTYHTESENFQNIQRGIETVRRLGLDPVGFVAPHGRFSPALDATVTKLGISHGGEFGLTYDDWPFWPGQMGVHLPSSRQLHRTLQIPIHPICLGLFDDSRMWLDYFIRTAEARYHAGEPLFFYGHPTGRLGHYPELLSQFLATIDQMEAVWKVTAQRMAEWWRMRSMVQLSVRREGEMIVVRREGPRPKFRLAVEAFRENRSALLEMDQPELRFSPESIVWQRAASFDDLVRPTGRPCRLGLRDRFKRAIDWEKETPIEELHPNGWRGFCKRTIRRMV